MELEGKFDRRTSRPLREKERKGRERKGRERKGREREGREREGRECQLVSK